jgi:hypothetical protein
VSPIEQSSSKKAKQFNATVTERLALKNLLPVYIDKYFKFFNEKKNE